MISKESILFLIPARKGSLGLKNKNIKLLGDLPLIQYSYDFAISLSTPKDEVCISTNDESIFNYFKKKRIILPFLRPDDLATSKSTSDSVIKHALDFFKKQNRFFKYVLFLQPTSPFRLKEDFFSLLKKMDIKTEMVVSVVKCKHSPYFNQFQECNQNLVPIPFNKTLRITRRQDLPDIFAYNGAYYFFRVNAFEKEGKIHFNQIIKFEMPVWRSIDIDTYDDWELAELYLPKFKTILNDK